MALEKIYQDTPAEAGAAAFEVFAADIGRRTDTAKPIEALNAALRLPVWTRGRCPSGADDAATTTTDSLTIGRRG